MFTETPGSRSRRKTPEAESIIVPWCVVVYEHVFRIPCGDFNDGYHRKPRQPLRAFDNDVQCYILLERDKLPPPVQRYLGSLTRHHPACHRTTVSLCLSLGVGH
ncbi:hypothetical protein CBL_09296 [Carabus blaptoides fortunei]